MFTFLSWLFGYIEKRFEVKVKVYFKIYVVTDWTTNNYVTYIVQYLKKYGKPDNEIEPINRT